MPQHALTGPRVDAIRIEVEDLTLTELTDGLKISLYTRVTDHGYTMLTQIKLLGRGQDMAESAIEEAFKVWLYGTPQEVCVCLLRWQKLARAHAKGIA